MEEVLQTGATAPTTNLVAATGSTETLPSGFDVHDLTMDASCTLTFPAVPIAGVGFTLFLRQNGTGGWVVTWPSIKWSAGAAPLGLTVAASGVDVLSFVSDGTVWHGMLASRDSR